MRASKENIKTNFLFFFIILGITLFVGIMFVYSSLFAIQNIKDINPEQKFKTYIIGLIIGFIGAVGAFFVWKFIHKQYINHVGFLYFF